LLAVDPNGHVVSQFGNTFLGKKSRQQNVRIRQIQLSCVFLAELRLNLKATASLVIEQRCKHCGRIEIRIAEKID
jgi:hypothetical protein